jgi:hypothetical protein
MSTTIIDRHPITRFATRDAAITAAMANEAYEQDGWTYTVTAAGERFVVVIREEDGAKVGCL